MRCIVPDLPWTILLPVIVKDAPASVVTAVHTDCMRELVAAELHEEGRQDLVVEQPERVAAACLDAWHEPSFPRCSAPAERRAASPTISPGTRRWKMPIPQEAYNERACHQPQCAPAMCRAELSAPTMCASFPPRVPHHG